MPLLTRLFTHPNFPASTGSRPAAPSASSGDDGDDGGGPAPARQSGGEIGAAAQPEPTYDPDASKFFEGDTPETLAAEVADQQTDVSSASHIYLPDSEKLEGLDLELLADYSAEVAASLMLMVVHEPGILATALMTMPTVARTIDGLLAKSYLVEEGSDRLLTWLEYDFGPALKRRLEKNIAAKEEEAAAFAAKYGQGNAAFGYQPVGAYPKAPWLYPSMAPSDPDQMMPKAEEGIWNVPEQDEPEGVPTCPPEIGAWDCEAIEKIFGLKSAFLDSAKRHNIIPGMDDEAFAALVASIIVGERRVGRIPEGGRLEQQLEDIMAVFSNISGHLIKDAWDEGDYGRAIGYVFNQGIPDDVDPIYAYASVGIGNMKLPTAANLWKDQACDAFGKCTPVQINSLQTKNFFGISTNLQDPFAPPPPSVHAGGEDINDAYRLIAGQLLDEAMAIEYVAAHLEAGALRAESLGVTPTAFNSVIWYIRSVHTEEEIKKLIETYPQIPPPHGHAAWVAANMSIALQVLGLQTDWQLDEEHEPEYFEWLASQK